MVSASTSPNQTFSEEEKFSPDSSSIAASPPPFNYKKASKHETDVVNSLTCSECTLGIGVIPALAGPMASKKEYSTLSVEMMVHCAPSLSISLIGCLGHGVA